ncbi:MAG: STAS domain-containing protein [Victivallaceae bacterium]|nr:STAS domain-containing protein [Victivallaceae bacterium]
MELSEKKIDEILVISVSGRLTADCADKFKRYMDDAMSRSTKVVLDLSGMDYIDSTGLGAVVFALQKLSDEGGALNLACLQSKPRIVLDITKAYKIFDIFDTVDEAVAAIRK